MNDERAGLDVWGRAVTAELSWGSGGALSAIPIVPLVWEGRPCAALSFDRADEVASLVHGGHATWTVTDPRTVGDQGVRFRGPVSVRDDLEGKEFVAHLLDDELRRHPPSRLRADSLVLRRENWWWLPRRLVLLDRVETQDAVVCRRAASDAVLVTDDPASGATTATVGFEGDALPGAGRFRLVALDDEPVRGAAEPALLMGHDYTVPDLSRWTRWFRTGVLRGDEFEVTGANGAPGASAYPLRLGARLRAEWALGRACRAGLRRAERQLVDRPPAG